MTKPLPFTESAVRRAIAAVRKAGLEVKATSIGADGTVTIFHDGIAPQPSSGENQVPSKWLDIEA